LFNLYGSFLCATLFGFVFARNVSLFGLVMWKTILCWIAAFCEAALGLSMFGAACQICCDLGQNQTQLQRMAGKPGDRPSLDSMDVVCGSGCPLGWLWPTPAFDETLVIADDEPPGKGIL
jgi:hypothetical protein